MQTKIGVLSLSKTNVFNSNLNPVQKFNHLHIVLLLDPEKSSILTKIRIAKVIAHELAHSWFGNLVTIVGFLLKAQNCFILSQIIEFRNGGTICG